jgi:hypothetical protein
MASARNCFNLAPLGLALAEQLRYATGRISETAIELTDFNS